MPERKIIKESEEEESVNSGGEAELSRSFHLRTMFKPTTVVRSGLLWKPHPNNATRKRAAKKRAARLLDAEYFLRRENTLPGNHMPKRKPWEQYVAHTRPAGQTDAVLRTQLRPRLPYHPFKLYDGTEREHESFERWEDLPPRVPRDWSYKPLEPPVIKEDLKYRHKWLKRW
ncbi:hypothetical protein QOT17_010352 [Balamuthia mandrillaris]